MDKHELSHFIKTKSRETGFHKVGIAKAGRLPKSSYLKEWLSNGLNGSMHWMESYLDKRLDVKKLYPDAKSIVSVGLNYYSYPKHSSREEHGKISRYAWGEKDYHKILKKKLKGLLQEIKTLDERIEGRLFVDTAPIQDKLWAQQAGIGWQGKHTNIISRDYGSWLFLGELVLDVDLEYDVPIEDFCGSCSACIDACPTQALEPYKIDATKCISYLTIEMWDKPIPEEQSGKLNNWIFGCDICQDVCPWNRFEQETDQADFQPVKENIKPDLKQLVNITEEEFRKRFKKSPVFRAKHKNFIRNVKTVLNKK
ncbi:MAG: tRNA epoxyqueuosine(34) reductase QueG [Calditrichaeota bacterium]|nr:MAG: tRNA epoxyqueuosine(34) reductase QueG [Calditrichota bacterium]MBL1205087.1 tRNA epoxyqueuosine(34) reductase QueG [Calditrichota bacterium]NOG44917.1 tRNA epoxyqueuosine(34) reductase QueG [Calditrichota bacterium]